MKKMVWVALAAMLALALAGACAESQASFLRADSSGAPAGLRAFGSGALDLEGLAPTLEQKSAANKVLASKETADLKYYMGELRYGNDACALACVLYNKNGMLYVASEVTPFENAGIEWDDFVKNSTLILYSALTLGSDESQTPGSDEGQFYTLQAPAGSVFPYENSEIIVFVYKNSPFEDEFVPDSLNTTQGTAAGIGAGPKVIPFSFSSKDDYGYSISGMEDSPLPGSPVMLLSENTYYFPPFGIYSENYVYRLDNLLKTVLNIINTRTEERSAEPPEKTSEPASEPSPTDAEGNDSRSIYYSIAVIAVSVLIIYIKKKRKKPASGKSDSSQGEPAAPEWKISIRGISGEMAGNVYPLKNKVNIGRDPAVCGIIYSDQSPTVSRLHCSVSPDLQSGTLVLRDEGSSQGTYCHDQRIPAHSSVVLKNSDAFSLAGKDANLFMVIAER